MFTIRMSNIKIIYNNVAHAYVICLNQANQIQLSFGGESTFSTMFKPYKITSIL